MEEGKIAEGIETADPTRRRRKRSWQDTIVRIVSATYGPSDGRRLFNGEIVNTEAERVPHTRDVLPHLRALLEAYARTSPFVDEPCKLPLESSSSGCHVILAHASGSDDERSSRSRFHSKANEMRRIAVPVMDGKSMNTVFGDPCPGTTKCLRVSYVFCDESNNTDSVQVGNEGENNVEICRSSFQEHERVILRRERTFYQSTYRSSDSCVSKARIISKSFVQSAGQNKWSLLPATSEIILPITLPFLDVRQRALCQLVCKCWRFVVRKHGVAQTVDANDPKFSNFTRSFLRGIIAQSYSSLQSLFLNDFTELSPEDLHPAIPHLRRLRALDISRCQQLNDSTLLLLSKHVAGTLEVLYMKGVCLASDEGVTALCKACRELRVLELSNVPITDVSGQAIGDHLSKLRALYMRDNFQLTNRSIDVITEKCSKLSQLTLWGCVRMSHLSVGFARIGDGLSRVKHGGCDNLVLLNLWGCFSLTDEAAESIGTLKNLRTLILSECHRLTDSFVVHVSNAVQHLHHLHLRYVRRITDLSINAIAENMEDISSLDLSFCTKISSTAIASLLQRHNVLSELRLFSCHQLDVTIPEEQPNRIRGAADGGDGRAYIDAIRSNSDSCLGMLDLRGCVGRHRTEVKREEDRSFLVGMANLGFEQKLPFFFVRRARWNENISKRLVNQILAESGDEHVQTPCSDAQ